MKLDELLSDLEKIENYGVQDYLDHDFDGACPCFEAELEVDGHKVKIVGRCWRVSENDQDLIVETDHPAARQIAEAIKRPLDAQEWYSQYTVVLADLWLKLHPGQNNNQEEPRRRCPKHWHKKEWWATCPTCPETVSAKHFERQNNNQGEPRG